MSPSTYCVDVNTLVYAYVSDLAQSRRALAALTDLRASPRGLGLLPVVATGFLRITIDPRILRKASPVDEAPGFLRTLLSSPARRVVESGPGYWPIFDGLVGERGPRASDLTDMQIAESALATGSTLVSYDRGFARFKDLAWINPARA